MPQRFFENGMIEYTPMQYVKSGIVMPAIEDGPGLSSIAFHWPSRPVQVILHEDGEDIGETIGWDEDDI